MRLFDRLNEWQMLRKSHSLSIPLSDEKISPFFIVSSGRSGTTLLRKKLSEYSSLHIPPESDDLIPRNAKHFIINHQKGWTQLTQDIFSIFKSSPCFKYWHIDLDKLAPVVNEMPPDERSYANLLDRIYRYHSGDKAPFLMTWGDKTPLLIYFLPWLRAVFPSAKYIHLYRDGRAVVSSMMKHQGYTLQRAAIRWRDSIKLFESHKRLVTTSDILEIRYEDFVSDPENQINHILAFLNVPEEGYKSTREVLLGDDVLPHHVNLAKPVTKDHVDSWRDELSVSEIHAVNKLLVKELRLKNYH
jgi:protein-tyrosine sulfotransferase